MGLMIASKELKKFKFQRVVAQWIQTDHLAVYLGIPMALKLEWDS
ncbi:uncharacterized protein G2W53_033561 [Senna tora]|uniref:Uncharacterized protein n=1 Tax=Senna tora TaxID=362788 RepID=A0A834W739_9FABA|nr:uncharacterized protein G2W53_033561 [Senna tora]